MVEIYSTPSCPYCLKAKEYFKENKVEFVDYDVSESKDKGQEMVEKSGQMGVPVIVIGDTVIVGFDKRKLDKALGL
ncbi:MAG: Uxx-star family glutaredoxin-like (seleno)protein [bacterium]|nr:Uxx-star family glutaredoxin-like (seleno)protein [bacterium]